MAREWQQTRMPEYILPNAVYYQSLWAVRDLERMERRMEELTKEADRRKSSSVLCDGPANSFGRPTEKKALEIISLMERIGAIKRALSIVPEVYRPYVMKSIIERDPGTRFPDKIWKIWKQRFLFQVAENLSLY